MGPSRTVPGVLQLVLRRGGSAACSGQPALLKSCRCFPMGQRRIRGGGSKIGATCRSGCLSARSTLCLLAAVPIKALLKACEWHKPTVLHLGGGLCLRFLHKPRREGLLRR